MEKKIESLESRMIGLLIAIALLCVMSGVLFSKVSTLKNDLRIAQFVIVEVQRDLKLVEKFLNDKPKMELECQYISKLYFDGKPILVDVDKNFKAHCHILHHKGLKRLKGNNHGTIKDLLYYGHAIKGGK